MILRKPYAFLIKHFRIIHIIVSLLAIYLAVKSTALISFFQRFAAGGRLPQVNNLAAYYINFFMYAAVILILVIAIIVYFLMYTKQKPTRFYTFLIFYYLITFILLTASYGILNDIQFDLISSAAARNYRDISMIFYIPQYFFIIFCAFRGIGFNLKKFKFNEDKELEVTDADREEIEVLVVSDAYKTKRKIRKAIRELRYYLLENKFIFFSLIGIVIVIIGTAIFLNRTVYNRQYREGHSFSYRSFVLTNTASTLTNLNTRGQVIPGNKYYLLVNFKVRSSIAGELDMRDFRLMIDGDIIYPTFNRREHFIDFGTPYIGERMLMNTERNYMLIFELDEDLVRREYHLRIVDRINFGVGTIDPSYRDLILRPSRTDTIVDKGTFEVNSVINFDDTSLGDTTLAIRNHLIRDSYIYEYNHCFRDVCSLMRRSVSTQSTIARPETLLILDYELELDDVDFKNNIRNDFHFFTHFASIRFTRNNETRTVSITNRTPSEFNNKYIMQVDRDVMFADSVELLITVRNQQYVIKLK